MKKRIEISVSSENRYGPANEYYHGTDIYLTCDERPDQALIDKIEKEINRYERIAKRHREDYIERQIRVDWGTLVYFARLKKHFPPAYVTSNCIGITIKVSDKCKITLLAPPIHIDTRLLVNPNDNLM